MKKNIEVSNRYSWFIPSSSWNIPKGFFRYMSVALAVTSTTCVINEEDTKNKSLEEEIAAAINDVKNKEKVEEPTVPPTTTHPRMEVIKNDKKIDDKTKTINVQYSFHKEQLAEQFYKTAALDYGTLGYGLTKGKSTSFGTEDEYSLEMPHQETASEMLTTGEAKEKFTKMQYAKMLGTASDVSFEERRTFDWWIKFNSSLFGLFMAESLTRDVDYSA